MKSRLAVALILIAPLAFAGTGKISGTVVDESGVPVPHLIMEAFPLDMGWVGRLPNTITDGQGHFSIAVPITQAHGLRWRVYPHEDSKYYPDLSANFYQTEDSHGSVVQLDEADPEANIQLRLGRKAGALKVKVTDAATGAPLGSIHCELARADNAHDWFRMDTSGYPRLPVTLLLPSNIDITVTISSPGYQSWTYSGVINVGPGQDLPLDIQLQPISATSSRSMRSSSANKRWMPFRPKHACQSGARATDA